MIAQFHCIFSERKFFLKILLAKWPRKLVAFFHGRTVKESNIFMFKPRSSFKTLGLIRLIKSYSLTKVANSKAFMCKLRDNATHILITPQNVLIVYVKKEVYAFNLVDYFQP